jgi:prefoldin subunit 5
MHQDTDRVLEEMQRMRQELSALRTSVEAIEHARPEAPR